MSVQQDVVWWAAVRIDRVVTSGMWRFDGQQTPVDTNVWLLGDDHEVLVVDASHNLGPVRKAIAGRRVFGIACTHGHSDHINQAVAASTEFGAPTMLHPDDVKLWHQTYPDVLPDEELVQNQVLGVAHVVVRVLHTPGHTPGSVSLYVPALESVFSGDTLFLGGPGRTGQSYSDFPTIIRSTEAKLLSLPPKTRILPGHGPSTTVAQESPHLADWIARGY
jgi:glyoxylase-like metal-dependent hydrolase (beta-lactamase superfamily II)